MDVLFGDQAWPKPFHIVRATDLVDHGFDVAVAAQEVGTTGKRVERACRSPDLIRDVLDVGMSDIEPSHLERAAQILGGLLLGRCAELAFERIYTAEMETDEFELRDLRESRTDTDYRLYNGQGRPVYRINIKFHGSQFRRALELVGLASEDCFPLATYKINSALQKQSEEGLPYFFAIVGVPHLTGAIVGEGIPESMIELVALVQRSKRATRKRDIEDAVVNFMVVAKNTTYRHTLSRILNSDWYVLSARRADILLRKLLFERVFALRVRNFARAFRGAELDMHFSLSTDLIPLRTFLRALRAGGPQHITTLMERGDF